MIRIFFILLFIPSILFSNDTEAYIKKYRKTAIKEMRKYGVPASITLAQGILESGSGNSRLAKKGRNHFGIKCTSDWHGRTIREDDDKKDECFRRYRKAKHSYRDHSEFLATKKRYAFLFEYDKRDYKAWANGLKQAGYATNPNYPTLLITLIEKYDLHKYDKRGAKRAIRKEEKAEVEATEKTKEKSPNNYKYHEVKKGDTLYSISKKYNLSIEELKNLNNKKSNDLFLGEKIRVQ
jgi:LysM repeat protein